MKKKLYVTAFLAFLLVLATFGNVPANDNIYAQGEEAPLEEKVNEEVKNENTYGLDQSEYDQLTETQKSTVSQILDAPESNVKIPRMEKGIVSGAFLFKDGTPNFTSGGGIDGNDNSETNQIVRSFDNIIYQLDFGFNGQDVSDIVVEATVSQGEDGWYAWDDTIMLLLGYDVEVSADGRTAKIFFDQYDVGQGSSVKIPLAVFSALNGSTVKPQFKVYVAGEEAKPENIMDVAEVTVSSKPSVNVQIPQKNLTEVAAELGADGYYYTYMFVPLQVSLASSGSSKGSEETTGAIAFDITLDAYIADSTVNTVEQLNADTTKYQTSAAVVDFGLVNAPSSLDVVQIIGKTDGTGADANHALSGSLALGKDSFYSVFDSGVMSASQNGSTVSVSFDNYIHDKHNTQNRSATKARNEIAFISAGLIVKVQGQNQMVNPYNTYTSAEVSAITAGEGVSGVSIVGQNRYTDDDARDFFSTFRPVGRSLFPIIQGTGYTAEASRIGENYAVSGDSVRVMGIDSARAMVPTDEKKFVQVMNFDPRVFEFDTELFAYSGSEALLYTGYQHAVTGETLNDKTEHYADGAYKFEYGVSSDCSEPAISGRKGIEDVPVATQSPYADIVWYDSVEAAMAAETGPETGADGVISGNKVCAARFTLEPGRNFGLTMMNVVTNYNMKIRNNEYTRSIADTGMTAAVTQYSISYNSDYDFATNTGSFYELGAGYLNGSGNKTSLPAYAEYIKPIYDADGNHINADVSNHTYSGRGNVIRLNGYDIGISKTVTDGEGNPLSKDNSLVPRVNNKVMWTLKPATYGGTYELGAENPVTVVDTLPAGLKLDTGSVTPKADSIVSNADGTTTMTWTYKNVVVGEPLQEITYITEVDRFSVDGQTYTNKVDMSVADKTATSRQTIRVLDDANFIVEKTVDNAFIDKDENINYTLTFQNRGTKPEDVTVYDILPYNGDNDISKIESGKRATEFNGTYEVLSHSTDANDYEVIYSYDEGIKTHTLDEATFKTEEEWGAEFDLASVTIIGYRIKALQPQEVNSIEISIDTVGNMTYDVYENNYSLWFASELNGEPIQIPLNSNTVKTQVLSRTISGTTWVDADMDGLRQEEETLITDVPVKLYVYDGDAVIPYINDEGIEYTTVTDENGYYEFSELRPGVYLVAIDVEYLNGELQELTVENTSDATLNSDAVWMDVNGVKYAVIDVIDLVAKPRAVDQDLETYIGASHHNDAGVIPLHALEVTKESDQTSFKPGMGMTYQIKVTNTGNLPLTNVVVVDEFDDPKFDKSTVKVVSVVDSSGLDVDTELYDATNAFSVEIGLLPVGEAYTITYTVNVRSDIEAEGSENLVNSVTVNTDETDPETIDKVIPPYLPDTGFNNSLLYALAILSLIAMITRLSYKKSKLNK